MSTLDNYFVRFYQKDIKVSYFSVAPQTIDTTFEEFKMTYQKIFARKKAIDLTFQCNIESIGDFVNSKCSKSTK